MPPLNKITTNGRALSKIIGASLTSVKFAQDHLVLAFDEKGSLTTSVWPLATASGRTLAHGAAGYRDQLCDLIGRTVKSAVLDDEEAISIFFAKGQDLFIPLRTYVGRGERAILTSPGHSPLFL